MLLGRVAAHAIFSSFFMPACSVVISLLTFRISNMEQSLNTAANNAVATAVASHVFERMRSRAKHHISEVEENEMKSEITTLALKMIQGRKKWEVSENYIKYFFKFLET